MDRYSIVLLDGRPHLVHVRVEITDISSYQALLEEVVPWTRPKPRAECCSSIT